ncbi:hypothetical protein HAX54_047679 [Datura stramonium]|uniref:Uncharacterized protein n=1 Tax=Datura stramonium TaxID=4076 RepID=A0ABS8STA9_DATST|nr:hypothetical protein [Datura stramonium]
MASFFFNHPVALLLWVINLPPVLVTSLQLKEEELPILTCNIELSEVANKEASQLCHPTHHKDGARISSSRGSGQVHHSSGLKGGDWNCFTNEDRNIPLASFR